MKKSISLRRVPLRMFQFINIKINKKIMDKQTEIFLKT